jgi:hypothetical protein
MAYVLELADDATRGEGSGRVYSDETSVSSCKDVVDYVCI